MHWPADLVNTSAALLSPLFHTHTHTYTHTHAHLLEQSFSGKYFQTPSLHSRSHTRFEAHETISLSLSFSLSLSLFCQHAHKQTLTLKHFGTHNSSLFLSVYISTHAFFRLLHTDSLSLSFTHSLSLSFSLTQTLFLSHSQLHEVCLHVPTFCAFGERESKSELRVRLVLQFSLFRVVKSKRLWEKKSVSCTSIFGGE